MTTIRDVLDVLDRVFPPGLADENDPIGLQTGDPRVDLTGIAVALEATVETVRAAVSSGANLLVTHHPLVFRPLNRIAATEPIGEVIMTAARSGVTVCSCHTNCDWVQGGLNDRLASRLGLLDVVPWRTRDASSCFKVSVFVPEEALGKVSEAMFAEGAGRIGEYAKCSFRTPGIGTFLPSDKADPYSGKIGELANEPELRLEVLVSSDSLERTVRAMIEAHPYEEPAFDVYALKTFGRKHGVARIGRLPAPETPRVLGSKWKASLDLSMVRAAGPIDRPVHRVVVCTGGGAFLLGEMLNLESTVLVTGDFRYHDGRCAEQANFPVIEIGHFDAEIGFTDIVTERLSELMPVPVIPLRVEKEPFTLI